MMELFGGQHLTSVVVHCGSSLDSNPKYNAPTQFLGQILAENNIELIYGGAKDGLMGIIADSVLQHGGKVTGVMPKYIQWKERQHTGLTNFIEVADMHERQAKMSELSHAAIVLPGGVGTFYELMEYATWTQIGIHYPVKCKPIGLLNLFGYYSHLRAQFNLARKERFLKDDDKEIVIYDDDIPSLIQRLNLLCEMYA